MFLVFLGIEGSTRRTAGAGTLDPAPSPLPARAVLPMSGVVIPFETIDSARFERHKPEAT